MDRSKAKIPSEQNNRRYEGTEPIYTWVDDTSQWLLGKHKSRDNDPWAVRSRRCRTGDSPQKYVTGALVEGELAALDIVEKLKDQMFDITDNKEEQLLDEKVKEYNNILSDKDRVFYNRANGRSDAESHGCLCRRNFKSLSV